MIEKLCLRDAMLAAEGTEEARAVITNKSPEVVKRVAQAERELSFYQTRSGVLSRESVLLNAKEMAPSDWWGLYGKNMPLLCSIAQTVLAQPVSASVAERNWSIYNSIRSERRTRLYHTTQPTDSCIVMRLSLCMQS